MTAHPRCDRWAIRPSHHHLPPPIYTLVLAHSRQATRILAPSLLPGFLHGCPRSCSRSQCRVSVPFVKPSRRAVGLALLHGSRVPLLPVAPIQDGSSCVAYLGGSPQEGRSSLERRAAKVVVSRSLARRGRVADLGRRFSPSLPLVWVPPCLAFGARCLAFGFVPFAFPAVSSFGLSDVAFASN